MGDEEGRDGGCRMQNYSIILKKAPEGDSGAEVLMPAVLIEEEHKSCDRIAGDPGKRIYLLFPDGEVPEPGNIIVDAEKEFEITEVKICRDISGKVRAVRCTALNN